MNAGPHIVALSCALCALAEACILPERHAAAYICCYIRNAAPHPYLRQGSMDCMCRMLRDEALVDSYLHATTRLT